MQAADIAVEGLSNSIAAALANSQGDRQNRVSPEIWLYWACHRHRSLPDRSGFGQIHVFADEQSCARGPITWQLLATPLPK